MAIVTVSELTKTYAKHIQAVDHVSFTVGEGEIIGLLGPNGAGKTTTIRMLTTLTKPTSGTALVGGYDILKEPNEVRRVIGIVPQNLSVDDDLTGRENMTLQASFYGMAVPEARKKAKELLDLMALTDAADRDVQTYSGGMRKRLEIACGLVSSPKVLFLDEPTLGLDVKSRVVVWDYLKRLNEDQGLTIFLTTHYMEEADSLCDNIVIMNRGKIVATGAPAALKSEVGGQFFKLKIEIEDHSVADELRKWPHVISLEKVDPSAYEARLSCSDADLQAAIKKLEAMRMKIQVLEPLAPSMSDVFLHYTGTRFEEEPQEGGTVEKIFRRRRITKE